MAGIVEQSTREGVLADTTGALSNAFEFTAKKVHDVEVPMDQIVALPRSVTPNQVQLALAEHGFSRYILCDGDGDGDGDGDSDSNAEPVGYVHLKDVMDLSTGPQGDQPFPAKRVRGLTSVLRDSDLEDGLASMRRNGSHVARSVDRNGHATGILFLEDIIEELVGRVEDAATTSS